MKRALISVTNKDGVVDFAKGLVELGFEIVSTGGTMKVLQENGVSCIAIDDVTGFPEMLDGRVKTLHPMVHGGLLYRRDLPSHVETIKKHFKGSVQKDLLNILYTSIELKNISKIYRYKQYFHESEDSIRSSLFLQYSRLPKDMMNRLISASGPKEVLSLLSTSKYYFYMDDKEFAYIEYYADSIQYNIAKRYMRFSNSAPLVYMTYSILQRIEIDNLKHIVEGIRYNQPVSKIENTLIYA